MMGNAFSNGILHGKIPIEKSMTVSQWAGFWELMCDKFLKGFGVI
jgi:hypothetical protein